MMIKEKVDKVGNDYIRFELKGYTVFILRIDDKLTQIEIRKGKRNKRLFYEKVEGGIK